MASEGPCPKCKPGCSKNLTPLLHAIRTGHNECVRALMKTARNFSEAQKRCVNVLAWVVHRKNSRDPSSILKILVKAEAEVNYSFQGYSALRHAVQWGYPSGVNTLVELGANVKKTYKRGGTPLHLAAQRRGSVSDVHDICNSLIKGGADINAADEDGDTPLMTAVLARSEPGIRALIQAGADMNLTNNYGLRALTIEMQRFRHTMHERLELLLSGGADVKLENKRALFKAVSWGFVKCVDLMIKKELM